MKKIPNLNTDIKVISACYTFWLVNANINDLEKKNNETIFHFKLMKFGSICF